MAPSNDTDNLASSVITCSAVLVSLTTFFMGIRVYTHFSIKGSRGWDDVFAELGYFFAMVLCVVTSIETQYGLGRHISTVSSEDVSIILKYNIAASLSYIFCFVSTKLAFVLFYLKIFPPGVYRICSYCVAAFLVAELIEETAVVLARCTPLPKAWNPELPGKCLNLFSFYYISFGIKLATDLVLFCLPIPLLGTLNINLSRKIGVIFMFSLGLFVCIISVVRATFLRNTNTDFTFILPPQRNWSSIEVCSLVICICIPVLRPFLLLFPSLSRLLHLCTHTSRSDINGQRQNSIRLEPRNQWNNYELDLFELSEIAATRPRSNGNDSQIEILQRNKIESKNGITVTTSTRIDHSNKSEN